MWGKMAERNKRTKSKVILDPYELYIFLATPGIEVVNLMFTSYDVAWTLRCFKAEDEIPSLCHMNEVIGAYVTAGVRLHLYSDLD